MEIIVAKGEKIKVFDRNNSEQSRYKKKKKRKHKVE